MNELFLIIAKYDTKNPKSVKIVKEKIDFIEIRLLVPKIKTRFFFAFTLPFILIYKSFLNLTASSP
jgi:hypothetical protein